MTEIILNIEIWGIDIYLQFACPVGRYDRRGGGYL